MADEFDIGDEIFKGVHDVFSTMLGVDLARKAFTVANRGEIKANMTSMIGLGGDIRGVLAIHCPAAVAKTITGTFLGMEVEEIDDDVKDAIGEIANMVAGNLKVSYGAIGIKVDLAIPTSIVGESFRLSGMAEAKRVIVSLEMATDRFWVELMSMAS